MDNEPKSRLEMAKTIAQEAGKKALRLFAPKVQLKISKKGSHDYVSNADKEIESFIRDSILKHFPNDGLIGEEQDRIFGTTGFDWIIDPIDGTSNFIADIPAWCIVLACVYQNTTIIGVVFEPINDELYWASKSEGAYLNGKPINVVDEADLKRGRVGVGVNKTGTSSRSILKFVELLEQNEGEFYRNGSGALMMTYVAAGRLLGYVEPFMNAWDCLAAELLILEAGGKIQTEAINIVVANGKKVIVSAPGIFDEIRGYTEIAFK